MPNFKLTMVHIVLHFLLQTFFLFVIVLCKNSTDEPQVDINDVDVKTLKFVHAIWRHGDRNPMSIFPTDQNNSESKWPQGFGELTITGMRQQYALGKFLKHRYRNFLSSAYNAKEIYVRSTDYNRTIMSALSNLAGMYPPNANDSLDGAIGWQPIPVHSRPKETDYLLIVDNDYPCPKAIKIVDDFIKSSPAIQMILRDNNDFFNFLKNNSGHKDVTLRNLYQLIYDPLFCIKSHKETHQWPKWVNQSVFDKVGNLTHLYTQYAYPTEDVLRLRGGPLFYEIAARMKDKSLKLNQPAKYYAYSAHDATIVALMKNIGAHDGYNPPYASAILFEMHERDGQFYVDVLRRNGTTEKDLRKVEVPNCKPCTVDKFLSLAQIKKPADIIKDCIY